MVQYVKGSLTLAPALIVMEQEANRLAPARSKASDGSFPSAAHTAANPTSDHETGDALDLTHDPADGFDVAERYRLIVARKDRRVKYLIHNGTIWRSYDKPGLPAWKPAVYTGSNPHTLHGHCSVLHEHRGDRSPWWPTTTRPQPAPPAEEEDDVKDQIVYYLNPDGTKTHAYRVLGLHGKYLGPGPDALELCLKLKIPEANSRASAFGPPWQGTVVLIDGPCRNVE